MKGRAHYYVFIALLAYVSKANNLLIIAILILSGYILWLWKRNFPLYVTLLFLFIFLWVSLYPQESSLITNLNSEENQIYNGRIVSFPENQNGQITFMMKERKTKEKVLVYVLQQEQEYKDFHYGQSCTVQGQLQVPNGARNPGNFDYQSYLKGQSIYTVLYTSSDNLHCEGDHILAKMYLLRNIWLKKLDSVLEDHSFSWVQAIIFGDRDYLSDEMIEDFNEWNLSHLLAISGLHVGLIVGLLYLFLNRLLHISNEKTKIILMIVLPIYAIFAGSAPPVIRAVTMTEVLFFASLIRKKWSAADVLSYTALLFILIQPTIVEQLSFQFSFLVTYTIILSKNILMRQNTIWNIVYISFISQLSLIPLQLYYFYYINPLSLFSNFLFVPYFSFIFIPITLMAVLLFWVPGFANVFNLFFHFHQQLLQSLFSFSNEGSYLWIIGKISLIAIGIYYVIFYYFLKLLETKQLTKAFLCSIVLIVLLLVEQFKPYINPYGSVTMLDVGQGDTIVVELPYRKGIMMIDAAKSHSFYEEVESRNNIAEYHIRPFLWSKGITKIDHLIITHEDTDHMGSLDYVLKKFTVKNVYIHPFMKDKVSNFSDNVSIHVLSKGNVLQFGSYFFHVLHPEKDDGEPNENSIVLWTTLGGKSFLFTGDIGDEVEQDLIKSYPNLQADILKVAHHGSKYSTSSIFLDKINPSVALISVGEHNMYGHPAKETLEKLEKRNINIYRTDQNGAIIFRFRNETGTFFPWIP